MRSRAWGRAGGRDGRDGRVGHSRTGGAGGGGGDTVHVWEAGARQHIGHHIWSPPPPSLLADCSCSLFCL